MAVTPFKSSDNFNMAGFNEKITEADNTYVAKTGGSMTGALSMGNNKITDVASPVNGGDVANKRYVDGSLLGLSKVNSGIYLGDDSLTKTINIGFTPKLFMVFTIGRGTSQGVVCINSNSGFITNDGNINGFDSYGGNVQVTFNESSVTFNSRDGQRVYNGSDFQYSWTAIG